ncbi:hypothetical protein FYK55_08125 [Roseiconus nitratireducens]|uniref:Uncharacterized protein n=1 Tax=Roseiconus nitratireducens TaxID=2605748 RepID=A0A5M6D9T7_9BACT|nr:hypothetical protein [Roseiconus nitratireducens]KAA5544307.1 hypothetical protein FYK55_08125 [Roseiconus nitratireducens]
MNDRDLLEQFEDGSLPLKHWNHRTHVKISFLYLRDHPFSLALAKMRRAIQAYNAANNVPSSEFEGYNETTTHAFMVLVSTTMLAYQYLFPVSDADSFCEAHPQLMSKHVLRFFYSPERRKHPEAKTRFIEPDLAPLPELPAT